MKQFLKYTFASCLGVVIAMFVCMIIFSMIIGVAVNSSSSSANKKSVKSESVLVVNLDHQIPELTNNTTNTSAFSLENPDMYGLYDMIYLIEHAAEDDKIEAMYIKASSNMLGLSNSGLVRDAIVKFKESGKPIYAHANQITQSPYLIASLADKIYLSPTGGFDFRGFGIMTPYYTNMMDKIGVDAQVFYAGNFKSATEPFRRTNMSEHNRIQLKEYLNESYDMYLQSISDARGIDVATLRNLAEQLSTSLPENALSAGLIDELGYADDAQQDLKATLDIDEDDKLNYTSMSDYFKAIGKRKKGTGKERIAIVFAEGEITDGKPEPGKVTGKEYTKILNKLKDDDKVKAVVLRVNSPGGSIIASDNIWKCAKELKESGKPLVVSMGNYAASGGYYISCEADKIFAQPNTITGSIGVFGMILNTRDLMENKLGLTFDTVATSKYANRMNGIYEFDGEVGDWMQGRIDNFYDLFLKRVADGRDISKEAVHNIAQGRIWTGNAAVKNGLVDEIGGLTEAVNAAAELAELEEYKIKEYPRTKNQFENLMEQLTGQSDNAKIMVDAAITEVIPEYSSLKNMVNEEPMARIPFLIKH